MASKQQVAKDSQGYCADYKPMFCMHCRHYSSVVEEKGGEYYGYRQESKIRCRLGNFSVKKQASCNLFEWKDGANG